MPKAPAKSDGEKIVALKEAGKTWGEISESVGLPQGKCMYLYEVETVSPKTRIAAKTEEELKAKIAEGRNEGLSWGVLSARSGKSEGYCKKAYEEITGQEALGNRIGKGGRYPGGVTPEMSTNKKTAAKAKGVAKKAAKKAPPAKKTAAAKKSAPAKKAPGKKVVGKKVAASKAE